ncbi:MAG TPA: hypothetical protein VFZ51_08645, partial [Woeseiaceae bacterium]
MPRIHAYLLACGITDDARRHDSVAGICEKLEALLPLHHGENPMEVAMRETVQWVEDHEPSHDPQRASEDATPPVAALAMPEQCIDLRSLRWSRKPAEQWGPEDGGDAGGGPPGNDEPGGRASAANGQRGPA